MDKTRTDRIRAVPRKGLSGADLKLIAAVSMVIDHSAMCLLSGHITAAESSFSADSTVYLILYILGRFIGRIAFPLYAFLLVEGFQKTRDRGRYLRRILAAAVLAQYPYNFALYGDAGDTRRMNTLFTFAIGLAGIWAAEKLVDRMYKKPVRTLPDTVMTAVLCTLVILTTTEFANVINSDYRSGGVLCIFVFYALYESRAAAAFTSYLVLTLSSIAEAVAFPDIFFITAYNGKRGAQYKYANYLFYVGHLYILWLMRKFFL